MNPLSILGGEPSLLNSLMELSEDVLGIVKFNILLNIPVNIGEEFQPAPHWQHQVYSPNTLTPKAIEQLTHDGQCAFSMAHSPVKAIVYQAFKKILLFAHEQFPRLIHPSAMISRSAKLDFGVQIAPQAMVMACVKLGFGVNIKRVCVIGHHSILDDFVTVNAGTVVGSSVHIGKGTRIGIGAAIRDHITIGENCLIGMGSVVTKDIPANSVAYGNPCRVQRHNPLRTS